MGVDLRPAPGDERGGGRRVTVQLLHLEDCPLVVEALARLRRVLTQVHILVQFEDIEGPCASPTLLVDGLDVTGRTHVDVPSCRLDLPTEAQITAALTAASRGGRNDADGGSHG